MNALGLIEVYGYPCAIEAADSAAKAANIKVLALSKVGSGIMTVQLMGDVGAIESAVQAGAMSAEKVGKVLHTHIIPRADNQLFDKGVIPVKSESPLSVKTNTELINMIMQKGIQPEKDLKKMKKEELIETLEKGKEGNDEQGK